MIQLQLWIFNLTINPNHWNHWISKYVVNTPATAALWTKVHTYSWSKSNIPIAYEIPKTSSYILLRCELTSISIVNVICYVVLLYQCNLFLENSIIKISCRIRCGNLSVCFIPCLQFSFSLVTQKTVRDLSFSGTPDV